jgi:hypothetical protein
MAAVGLMGVAWPQATEAQEVNLGTAAGFAVLAHESITNTGPTVIGNAAVKADIGVSPGTSITGFPPGIVVPPGEIHNNDPVAAQALIDANAAFTDLMSRAPTAEHGMMLGMGEVLTTGGLSL